MVEANLSELCLEKVGSELEDRLPTELWRLVLERLDVGETFRFALVARLWRNLTLQDSFWLVKIQQMFPMAGFECDQYRHIFCSIWSGNTIIPVDVLNPGCREGSFGSAVLRCVSSSQLFTAVGR